MNTCEQSNQLDRKELPIEVLVLRDYRPRTEEELQRDHIANLLIAKDMVRLQQLAAVNAL